MARESNVFILGAGASVSYGYPTGFELNERIKDFLRKYSLSLNNSSDAQTEEIKVLLELGLT